MSRLRAAALLLVVPCLVAGCLRPCSSPLLYRLGEVDQRFGISPKDLLSVLRRAEDVWEDASGRNLFRYAEDGELVVNLVYDARQMTAQDNLRRTHSIDKTSRWADEAKTKYERARARYEAARRDFEAAGPAHEARLEAYNRRVLQWNSRGGAPGEGQALEREEASLRSSEAALEKKRLEVNSLASRANDLSERYNELVDEVRVHVDAINTTAGQEFKQGRYFIDSEGVRIEVYEFVNRTDLVHVLAHEMGHALGILHNDNADSIMFGRNSSQTLVPTREDLASLDKACRF